MFNVLVVVVGFAFICKILLRYLLMPMLGHDDAAKDYELRLNMEDYLCMSSKPIRTDPILVSQLSIFSISFS